MSTFKDQYLTLNNLLLPWQNLWQHSILQNYPDSLLHFPKDWVESLRGCSLADWKTFDDERSFPALCWEMQDLLRQLSVACRISEWSESQPLSKGIQQNLSAKKLHELERLAAFLSRSSHSYKHAVDVGGGAGHLARMYVSSFPGAYHSLDRDLRLQEEGRGFVKRLRNFPAERLEFIHAELRRGEPQNFDSLFERESLLSMGLHTCGDLAWIQFEKSLRAEAILNFGCCYDKILEFEPHSAWARSLPLRIGKTALFLATRGRKGKTEAEFSLQLKVYSYRFALELWLRQMFPLRPFSSVGDASRELYRQSFAAYVRDRMQRMALAIDASDDELENFYREKTEQVSEVIVAHLIRSLFARPLEICVLLDRAIWLEDKGFSVQMLQVFDREVSPRNIGIFARR